MNLSANCTAADENARWPDPYLHLRAQRTRPQLTGRRVTFETPSRKQLTSLTHFSASIHSSWSSFPFSTMLSIKKDYCLAGIPSETVSMFQNLLSVKERKELRVNSGRFTQLGDRLQMRKTSRPPREKGKPRSFCQLRFTLTADCARRWDPIA